MNNNPRIAAYAIFGVAILATLSWVGIIPIGVSAAGRIAGSWEATYGSRSKLDEEGRLVQLVLRSAEFGDDECDQLLSMPDLTTLDLSGTSVTDDSLVVLAKLESLKTLRLDSTRVTNAGLSVLAEAPKLTDLSLSRCQPGELTEDGIGMLSSLESVNLMDTGVSDASVRGLLKLKELKQLYLGRTNVTSASLSMLSSLTDLELLNLASLEIVDDGDLAPLGAMPALQFLYLDQSSLGDSGFTLLVESCVTNQSPVTAVFLEGCPISDASRDSLMQFVKLPELGKLRLTGTRVSREVFDELVSTAPEISFAHGASGVSEE